ncbi:S-layer homology domain-containing protein [Aneurinibacillus sp. REN35]|uniref:S-layer homology domain-containing protein n=1 Tax=Aneurinibacillus sp. REN35 TaxID=3237286 RepID=UPI0035270472
MKIKAMIVLIITSVVFSSGCMHQDPIRADMYRPFDDIDDSYARTHILDLHSRGIVYGEGERRYGPRKPVTREAMAAMLGRTLQLSPIDAAIPAFTDVPRTSWSYGMISAGVIRGLISGTSASTYEPRRSITRQEAAGLLYRALPTKQSSGSSALPFHDAARIADWAKPAVSELYARGLIVGDQGRFRPNDPLTREEMAVLLYEWIRQEDVVQSEKEEKAVPVNLGWQYSISTQEFTSRVARAPGMNIVSPRWYFIHPTEMASDATETQLLTWAKKNGREVWPLVGNRFNKELTHQLLANPDKRAALVQKLAGYTQKYAIDGLNIDFENIDPADRLAFTAFVRELSTALHAHGKKLSVDVPPDLDSDWSNPYDFATLARHADYVIMMAYNETWEGLGKAGSNASLPWVRRHVEHMLTMVPKERLIVALPLYTMRWQESAGKAVPKDMSVQDSIKDVEAAGIKPVWDARLGQYYAIYNSKGIRYKMWLEESRSLALKYRMVQEMDAAGVAFWYVGSETNEIWSALANERRP